MFKLLKNIFLFILIINLLTFVNLFVLRGGKRDGLFDRRDDIMDTSKWMDMGTKYGMIGMFIFKKKRKNNFQVI